jgi:hypothetical protein
MVLAWMLSKFKIETDRSMAMNLANKTTIMSWVFVFSLASATHLYADANNGPMIINQSPHFEILNKMRGNWKVTAIRHYPDPKTITYDENFDWVLNRRFLRGETSQKSDGTKSMSMIWYDLNKKAYRFMIFDSTSGPGGEGAELPPATWNEKTQTMEWDTRIFPFGGYTGYLRFLNNDMIQWNGVFKDWSHRIIVDVDGTSIRRK